MMVWGINYLGVDMTAPLMKAASSTEWVKAPEGKADNAAGITYGYPFSSQARAFAPYQGVPGNEAVAAAAVTNDYAF